MRQIVVISVLLAVLTGSALAELKGDINDDNQIGLEEAIYALQVVAGVISDSSTEPPSNPFDSTDENINDIPEIIIKPGSGNMATAEISLKQGANLFSIPVLPADTSIETVLKSLEGRYKTVWSYENNNWENYTPDSSFNTVSDIKPGLGYWISMNEPGVLSITGSTGTKIYDFNTDWSLVGFCIMDTIPIADFFSSAAEKIDYVYSFQNGRWLLWQADQPLFSDLSNISPGYAYWVKAKEPLTFNSP